VRGSAAWRRAWRSQRKIREWCGRGGVTIGRVFHDSSAGITPESYGHDEPHEHAGRHDQRPDTERSFPDAGGRTGECRRLGLDQILLTCGPGNLASRQVVLANGGRPDGNAAGEDRFWITATRDQKTRPPISPGPRHIEMRGFP
jgi:hypothetical protein